MTPFLQCYLIGWIGFCILAAIIAGGPLAKESKKAIRMSGVIAFLRVPWRVALFVPAILFVTFAGRFTDDETWDVVSGGGMSILTVATSWWVVGTAVHVVRRRKPLRGLVVATAVMLFSSSWFYDGYLLLRDGAYTQRWLGNLMLSPTIYLCAGVVMNLESRSGRRIAFAFERSDWPTPPSKQRTTSSRWPLVAAAIPLIAIAGYFLIGFVGWRLPQLVRD